MSFTDEERKVLLDSAIKKLEESAKTFKNDVFSYYPHGLAYGLEQQIDKIRMHHRKPFDFDDEYADIEECEREQKEEVQSRANLDDFMKKLDENKHLLEKCHAYLPERGNSSKLCELECDVKMCEATLTYIGKLVEIAGTWKKLYEFMSNISSNDR